MEYGAADDDNDDNVAYVISYDNDNNANGMAVMM